MPSAGGEGVEAAEVVAVVVATTVEAEVAVSKTLQLLLLKTPPNIKVPSTPICPLESGGVFYAFPLGEGGSFLLGAGHVSVEKRLHPEACK